MKREIQGVIDETRQVTITASSGTLSSVMELIRIRIALADSTLDANPDLIALADRTLEISTQTIRPHSATDYLTSSFPFAYDPTVRSDVWEYFLSKVIPADYLSFLQEFSGYCLTTDTGHELAVWLWGPSGCGKSTFLEGLRAAFGNRATTFSINNLDSRFGLYHLKGKTLAISTEQPGTIKQAQVLNQLISGEGVMVEQKYEDPHEFFNRAKFFWAMNELPKIDKFGVGLDRRVVVVKLPPLEASKRDANIKRQIQQSGPAIFNWAMDGYRRFQQRGFLVRPESPGSVVSLVSTDDNDIEVTVA